MIIIIIIMRIHSLLFLFIVRKTFWLCVSICSSIERRLWVFVFSIGPKRRRILENTKRKRKRVSNPDNEKEEEDRENAARKAHSFYCVGVFVFSTTR